MSFPDAHEVLVPRDCRQALSWGPSSKANESAKQNPDRWVASLVGLADAMVRSGAGPARQMAVASGPQSSTGLRAIRVDVWPLEAGETVQKGFGRGIGGFVTSDVTTTPKSADYCSSETRETA